MLKTKYLHSQGGQAFMQKIDYKYNIRGWLTAINEPSSEFSEGDRFGMRLWYNKKPDGSAGLFNGNISATAWSTPNYKNLQYAFTYNRLNRLTVAEFTGEGFDDNSFKVNYSYDYNGNIKSLRRYGMANSPAIDDIDFGYITDSNVLDYSNDGWGDAPGVEDFSGSITGTGLYTYDANGNMEHDYYKGLNVSYNYMNLPEILDFGDDNYIYYFYNSTGEKMLRTVDIDSVANKNTYYFGPFVHEGTDGSSSSLKYILTPEGRILNKGTDTSPIWDWEYYLKDHLGNVRVVIAPTGEAGYSAVQQETHYYPYGMRISQLSNSANSTNKYLFSGKLLDDDFGLNWYDLHWRNYDPALCRFHTIDPMSEKHYNYTGYAYVYNNPLRFIDFMGLDSLDAIALTESAENAVDEITDEYGSSSAQCNRGVATAFEDLTGSNEFDDMTANEMYDHMESSDDFEQVEQSDLQEEANDGTIVIGAKQETGSGHIVMGVPGKEEYSGTWQENVPQVMDTGKDRRKSQTKISNSWGSSSKNNITYFRYKGETYTSRTYHGSKINNVTIRTKGIKYLQPLPVTIKY